MNPSQPNFKGPDKVAGPAVLPGHRLLTAKELPKSGDVFSDEKGVVPWEGPVGFRADAFIKPIYRPHPINSRRCGSAVFSVPARTFNSQLVWCNS